MESGINLDETECCLVTMLFLCSNNAGAMCNDSIV